MFKQDCLDNSNHRSILMKTITNSTTTQADASSITTNEFTYMKHNDAPILLTESPFGSLYGIRILESPACVERKQWRFPRSKKRRIRDRWTKREGNVRYEPRACQQGMHTIICHPLIAAQLQTSLLT